MTTGEPGIAWLFSEALRQPVGSRDLWLETATPDAATRDDVRELLRVYEENPGFLEAPIDAAAAIRLIEGEEGHPARARRFGPYRLVREIGRGGMGVVYEATRDDAEFERRVAIKVLPAALASATHDERFRFERQVLAGLDHPNIARLFDAGTSDDDVPYLVMEYVDGAGRLDGFSRDGHCLAGGLRSAHAVGARGPRGPGAGTVGGPRIRRGECRSSSRRADAGRRRLPLRHE